MYREHRIDPDLEAALKLMPPALAYQVRSTYADYASLLKTAASDREAVLGFVDTLGYRLDDLPQDPEAARVVATNMAKHALETSEREGAYNASKQVKE